MELEKMTFTLKNTDGNEMECEALLTFESEDTGKNYIVYTDKTLDSKGRIKIYSSSFVIDDDKPRLFPIETEDEWEIVQRVLDDVMSNLNNYLN